jgi:hypothetical protein
VRELLRAVVEAETDWRDVLVAADLAGDDWARRVDELLAGPADDGPTSGVRAKDGGDARG